MSEEEVKTEQPTPKRPRITAPDADVKQEVEEIPAIPKLTEQAAADLFSKVEEVQVKLDELNEKASEEILAVEQRFNKLRKPHYDDRAGFIAQIPHFWMTALMNHSAINELVSEEEEECLGFLKNLELEESEDIKSGCKLTFTWYPNRFFENDVIVKDFKMIDLNTHCDTTEIKWKIPRNKEKNKLPSFFAWLDGSTTEPLDILDVIREDIYANPVYYFSATEGVANEHSSASSSHEEEDEEIEPEDSDE
uniref:Nucleosome assembly protein (NAP) n=1 Tax=Panagrellus redivivus TaxID=6233 RepID=A0A7E4VHI7_PANRE